MIYLASPYSHEDPAVMTARFEYVSRAAGCLMKRGLVVFSPITHSHTVAHLEKMPTSWDFWREQDLAILALCEAVYVLKIPGWASSVGVLAEIAEAERLGLPVFSILPCDLDPHLHDIAEYDL